MAVKGVLPARSPPPGSLSPHAPCSQPGGGTVPIPGPWRSPRFWWRNRVAPPTFSAPGPSPAPPRPPFPQCPAPRYPHTAGAFTPLCPLRCAPGCPQALGAPLVSLSLQVLPPRCSPSSPCSPLLLPALRCFPPPFGASASRRDPPDAPLNILLMAPDLPRCLSRCAPQDPTNALPLPHWCCPELPQDPRGSPPEPPSTPAGPLPRSPPRWPPPALSPRAHGTPLGPTVPPTPGAPACPLDVPVPHLSPPRCPPPRVPLPLGARPRGAAPAAEHGGRGGRGGRGRGGPGAGAPLVPPGPEPGGGRGAAGEGRAGRQLPGAGQRERGGGLRALPAVSGAGGHPRGTGGAQGRPGSGHRG